MPIEPVKIPQNVYIEDRIVGPLTLRQTLIMAIGGGFSYALWASIAKVYGSVPLAITILVWIPCAIAVAFALIKINDLSLMRICFLMFERFNKPSIRTFSPRRGISINIRVLSQQDKAKKENPSMSQPATDERSERIKELSSILDSSDHEMLETEEDMMQEPAHELPETEHEEMEERPRRPVDPGRISANEPDDLTGHDDLTAVFRDIFPLT